jgi:hypothetical protein
MASTYEKIATTTLGSATATVTLSSIPATYTDLVVIMNMSFPSSGGDGYLRFNSDTGTNYSYTQTYGVGTSVSSNGNSNVNYIRSHNCVATAGTNNAILQINNYANTTTNKTVLIRSSDANYISLMAVGLWRNTNAITSLTFSNDGGVNFNSGSTFTIYGILKA